MTELSLQHFLVLSAILFCLGLFCVLTRRNAIGILMGIEMILNSANLNYVAFARYNGGAYDGQIFAIFVIMLAAAEAAVGLAIIIAVFRHRQTVNADDLRLLRW